MSKASFQGIAFLTVLALCACAQTPPVPSEYRDLYDSLQGKLDSFDHAVGAGPRVGMPTVAFASELSTANASRGVRLLDPGTFRGVMLELDRLQGLGVRAVTVAIAFPMLYPPFHQFNNQPGHQEEFLNFYKRVAAEVRKRGMKLLIESGLLFPGYSANSNFRVADYYSKLSESETDEGRARLAITIAKELRPDWLTLGTEPDIEGKLLRRPFRSPEDYAERVSSRVKKLRAAGVSGTPQIGAGIGTWQRNGRGILASLLKTDLDFINLHIYPVNLNFLTDLITYTEMAEAAGKKVGIGEAWLQKQRDSELATVDVASGDLKIFARDTFSFWAPLDARFIGSLAAFANRKRLLFVSPFWDMYFFAYNDYDQVKDLPNPQIIKRSLELAVKAMVNGDLSETGRVYKSAIMGDDSRPERPRAK